MIVDSDPNTHSAMTPNDLPPSYDAATEPGSPQMGALNSPAPAAYNAQPPVPGKDIKVPAPQAQAVVPTTPGAGTSAVPSMGPTPVYHYVNPATHEHVASLLPPNHPQMVCLQEGRHLRETRYGILGVLAAVFWFPLGIGLCLLDRRVKCRRCGLVIDDGICG